MTAALLIPKRLFITFNISLIIESFVFNITECRVQGWKHRDGVLPGISASCNARSDNALVDRESCEEGCAKDNSDCKSFVFQECKVGELSENPERVGVCLSPTFELNITTIEMTSVEESWVGLKKSKFKNLYYQSESDNL